MKKNVTLKVDSKIYDTFRKISKKEGLIISRLFEIMLEEKTKYYTVQKIKPVMVRWRK